MIFDKKKKIVLTVYSFNDYLDLRPLQIHRGKSNIKINLLVRNRNKKHYILIKS